MCCAQFFRQFKVLAWKNYLLKIRGWQILLMEIIIPIVIIIALGGVKVAIGQTTYSETYPQNYHDVTAFDDLYTRNPTDCLGDSLVWSCQLSLANCGKFNPLDPYAYLKKCQMRKIAVTPSSAGVGTASDTAAKAFVSYMNMASPFANQFKTFVYFPSEQNFIDYTSSKTYTITGDIYSAGVIFNAAAPQWDYVLRMNRTYYPGLPKRDGNPSNWGSPDTSSKAEDISVISPSNGGAVLSGIELTQFSSLGV